MKATTTMTFKAHTEQVRSEWYQFEDDSKDKLKDELFALINLGIIN